MKETVWHAQLDVQVGAPPIKYMQVDTRTDLTLIPTTHIFLHKMVWVIDEQAYYYLFTGNGDIVTDWKRYGASVANIPPFDPTIPYTADSVVYMGNVIFIALNDAPAGSDPLTDDTIWRAFGSGAGSLMYKFSFTDEETLNLAVPKQNAIPAIFLDTGEQIQADVTQLSASTYLIEFSEELTGYVLI